jgi:hypothetical protein
MFMKNYFKKFSTKIIDKEKRLAQFFKLPKHNIKNEQIYERPEVSVLETMNEEQIDKLDLLEKIIKKKKQISENKINTFFSNLSDREAVKVSENLLEKLRLKKEFKFDEDFKQK